MNGRPAKNWQMKVDLSDAELGWAAGILDGEGCVGIFTRACRKNSDGRGLQMLVSVGNTDFRMVLRLKELFGGNVSKLVSSNRPNRRAAITWSVSGRHAARVLEKVIPYLVVKREQAELALAFVATMNVRGPLPRAVRDERMDLYGKVRALKRFDFGTDGNAIIEFGGRKRAGSNG